MICRRVRDQKHTAVAGDRRRLRDCLLSVTQLLPAGQRVAAKQHITLRECVALEPQATTNVLLVFSTCSFEAGKSHSNSDLHPRNDASGHAFTSVPEPSELEA